MRTAGQPNPETSPMPVRGRMFFALREKLSQRPDSEHQAAMIRIVITVLAACYLVIAIRTGSITSVQEWNVIAMIAIVASYATGVFISILVFPQASVWRRILSMVVDVGATTYAIYFLHEVAMPFFGLYLFNACGNGFRFGPRYLYLSTILSVSGFTFALVTSEYWTMHRTMGIGLLIVLIVIPVYFATLVRQLHTALARLHTVANHDTLTGLPNRHSFYEQLQLTLRLAKRKNASFAVAFVDLDGFKPINDALGHAAGDTVLKSVANRLKQCVRNDDIVARFGGDEFVIILSDIHKTAIPSIARKIVDTIAKPLKLDDQTVIPTSSMGIATYPDNGQSVDELIAHADAAMYKSKRTGRNYFCLDGESQTVSLLAVSTKEHGSRLA